MSSEWEGWVEGPKGMYSRKTNPKRWKICKEKLKEFREEIEKMSQRLREKQESQWIEEGF